MSNQDNTQGRAAEQPATAEGPPNSRGGRLKLVGPGLLIAATGIGAGDMVTAIVAGTDFRYTLLWVIVIGVLIKFPLSEAIGRYYMATGQTVVQGFHRLGRAATGYFIVYLLGATFITSAGLASVAGLAAVAMFPGVMPVWAWAIIHSVVAFVLVGLGRYGLFEKMMEILVGLMFVTAIVLAAFLVPDMGNLSFGLAPRVPDGSLLNVLAIIGGIGGVYSLTYYPYWANGHGWNTPSWIPVMRTDLGVGYAVEGIFMVAMMIIGAELLFGTGTEIGGSDGLLALSDPLTEQFGGIAKWLFLIGFWAAVYSSILGNWNGASHVFADMVRTVKNVPASEAASYLDEKNTPFRIFLLWITFPPMILLAFSEPIVLVLAYTALGALFFPFLAVALYMLLNAKMKASPHRNRAVSNVFLILVGLFFVWSAGKAIFDLF